VSRPPGPTSGTAVGQIADLMHRGNMQEQTLDGATFDLLAHLASSSAVCAIIAIPPVCGSSRSARAASKPCIAASRSIRMAWAPTRAPCQPLPLRRKPRGRRYSLRTGRSPAQRPHRGCHRRRVRAVWRRKPRRDAQSMGGARWNNFENGICDSSAPNAPCMPSPVRRLKKPAREGRRKKP
jgi:hypothetical protein